MIALDLLRDPLWQRVALVLLHFLWEGAAVALALALAQWVFRIRRPQARYAASLCALLVLAAFPLATFFVVEPVPTAITPGDGAVAALADVPDLAFSAQQVPVSPAPDVRPWRWSSAIAESSVWVGVWAPYLVAVWLGGVLVFAMRLLLGFAAVHWTARSRRPLPDEWLATARHLAQRIGLRRMPRVAAAERAREAMAVGFVRPLVLLPAAWLTELPPGVLEAVLAHELAHIRRWDLWVNLMQRLLETLLFYHPAVWWVSRRLRVERELCCDDLAVMATGQRVEYAQALECVAQRRISEPSPLLAAGIGGRKMALLKRVRHVLGVDADGTSRSGRWSAGLIALVVPPALWLATSVLAPPLVGQEEREREARERERSESPEARERERERSESPEAREPDHVVEAQQQAIRQELERAIQEAQRQAQEAKSRAEEARYRAEQMVRRAEEMMQQRQRQLAQDERIHAERRVREARESGREREDVQDVVEELRDDSTPMQREMMRAIRELREEVERLRREVNELRQQPGPRPFLERRRTEDGEDVLVPRFRLDRPTPPRPPLPPGPPDRPRAEREEDRERDPDPERGGDRDRDPERDFRLEIRRLPPGVRPPLPPGAPDRPRVRIEREVERRDRPDDAPRDGERRDERRIEIRVDRERKADRGAEADESRERDRPAERRDGEDEASLEFEFAVPDQWDVTVMSNPENALNYLKRLVQLPGDFLEFREGDVPVPASEPQVGSEHKDSDQEN